MGNTIKTAYLGLGSNIGDRLKNLQSAVDSLKLLPNTKVKKASPVFETEPVGYLDQQNFYNAVIKIETGLSPNALLGALLGIEAAMGRVRLIKDGPRNIDIDLLLYEGAEISTEELTVPHPRMFERDFVIEPLRRVLTDEEIKVQLKPVNITKIVELNNLNIII